MNLAIFDIAGRRVRLLVAGARSEPGEHSVSWDGRDDTGARVGEGGTGKLEEAVSAKSLFARLSCRSN